MTKILFVCHGNVARSQWAEAYYNFFTKSRDAESAGISPNTPYKFAEGLPQEIIGLLWEEGIDIKQNKAKMISEEAIKSAEKVIVLCNKDICPDYFKAYNKIIYNYMDDPYRHDMDEMRTIRKEIKEFVRSLV